MTRHLALTQADRPPPLKVQDLRRELEQELTFSKGLDMFYLSEIAEVILVERLKQIHKSRHRMRP